MIKTVIIKSNYPPQGSSSILWIDTSSFPFKEKHWTAKGWVTTSSGGILETFEHTFDRGGTKYKEIGFGLKDRQGRLPIGQNSFDLGFGEGGISGKYSFLVGEDNIDNGLGYNFISGGRNELNSDGVHFGSFMTGWLNKAIGSSCSMVTGFGNIVDGSGFLGVIGYKNKIYKGESAAGASYSLTVGTANTLYGNGGSLVVGWEINLKDSTKDQWSNKYNLISGHTLTLEDIMVSNISGHRHNIKESATCDISGHRHNITKTHHSIIGGGRNNLKNSRYNIISGEYITVSTDVLEPEDAYGVEFSLISGQYNTATDAFFSNLLGERLKNNYKHKTVLGKYNENKEETYLEIGWGSANNDRKNIFEVNKDGTATLPESSVETITKDKDIITLEFLQSKFGYGDTAERPLKPLEGYCYFNSDTKKPEWFDGENWVTF